ncbi:hypothetical protein TNCV_4817091 [Trichonephila clavipes]|nr:hypothetical protein TNCV_4817091 [Trichonephila clavipes]
MPRWPPLTATLGWHQHSILPIKFLDTGMGSKDNTWSNPCFNSCNDLRGGFQEQHLNQSSPEYALSNSGPKIELGILFTPQTMILKIIFYKHSSATSHIIIHRNEFITNSNSISIKDIPISRIYSESPPPMEYIQVRKIYHPERYFPKQKCLSTSVMMQ